MQVLTILISLFLSNQTDCWGKEKLIKLTELRNPRNRFVKNGFLKIKLDLTVDKIPRTTVLD